MFNKFDVMYAARRVVERHGDNTNPGGGCKYTVNEWEAGRVVTKHCLGGMIIIELGGHVPAEDDMRNTTSIRAFFHPAESEAHLHFDTGIQLDRDAIFDLNDIQSGADSGADLENAPKWKDVVERFYSNRPGMMYV